jgi:membrane protein
MGHVHPIRETGPRAVTRPMTGVLVNFKELTSLFRHSFSDWNKHNDSRLGAALAFYTIVSMSPLAILVVAMASLAFRKDVAQSHLLDEVQQLVGPAGRQSLQAILESGHKHGTGIFSAAVGMATLFLGASGVFQELRSALNTIWETNTESSSGVGSLLRERVFSFGMVLSVGFVLLVSLLVSAALAAVSKFFSGILPVPPFVLGIADYLVSVISIAILFACILKYVPAARVEWCDVRVGATVTAVLFVIGKALLGFYLGMSSPGSSYGAAGSLVVLVVWVYYSAQIFYFGAEFTHVHSLANRQQLPSLQTRSMSGQPDLSRQP